GDLSTPLNSEGGRALSGLRERMGAQPAAQVADDFSSLDPESSSLGEFLRSIIRLSDCEDFQRRTKGSRQMGGWPRPCQPRGVPCLGSEDRHYRSNHFISGKRLPIMIIGLLRENSSS